jgi:hypothetical protein
VIDKTTICEIHAVIHFLHAKNTNAAEIHRECKWFTTNTGYYKKNFTTMKEYIHNVLNGHNVAKYCKFDARGTVVPHTITS